MSEQTLFEFERHMDTDEVADYLHTIANNLEAGDDLTLEAGDASVTLDPPGNVEFEVEVERDTDDDPTEVEIEFELEWPEGATGDGDLTIS